MRLLSVGVLMVIGVFATFPGTTATHLQAEPIPVESAQPAPTGSDNTAPDPAPAASEEQPPELAQAVAAFNERRIGDALKLLHELARKDADIPPAQVVMAQLFNQAKLGNYVRPSLEQAVIDAPDDPEAYVLLGELALRDRRVTDAHLLYTKASELVPALKSAKRKQILEPRVFSGLAGVAEARRDWATAQRYLEACLKADLDNVAFKVNARQRFARVLFQQKKPKEALEQLRAAKATDPKVLTPEVTLAQLYERAGDHKAAKEWMKHAAGVVAKADLPTQLAVARWALETEELVEAERYAVAALKIDSTSVQANVLRGLIALFQKQYERAESYFFAAYRQEPNDFSATNNLALALVEQDDNNKKRQALGYAESNFKNSPNSPDASSTYGWVLYRNGRVTDAERVLRKTAASGNYSPDTAYYIAQVSAERSRPDEAKRLLQAALRSRRPFAMRREAEALLKKLGP